MRLNELIRTIQIAVTQRDMVFRPLSWGRTSGRVVAICSIAVAASFSFLSVPYGYAVEPWADPNLPVRDGLELWLDATHATGDQAPPADDKLSQWRDVAQAANLKAE